MKEMSYAEQLRQIATQSQNKVASHFIQIFKSVAEEAARNGKNSVIVDVPAKVYDFDSRKIVSEFLRQSGFTSFRWSYDSFSDKRNLFVSF